MAIMIPSNVFQPEFVGPTAVEILFLKNLILSSGFVADARAFGAFADTADSIKFPKFTGDGALGIQTLPSNGSAVTPDNITMSYDTETSIDKIIAYQWTQKALETASKGATSNPGSVEQFMANTVARKVGNAIQASIISAAETKAVAASQVFTEPGGFTTYSGLLRTEYAYWGEYAGDGDTLLIMHPDCVYDLLTTAEVQKAQVYGAPPSVVSGKVSMIAGKMVLASSAITTSGSGASKTYNNLIVRRDAIQFFPLRDLTYQEQPVANSDTYNTWFTFRYAVHVAADKPTGVIEYVTGSSLNS